MQEKHNGVIEKVTLVKSVGTCDLVELRIGFDHIKAWGDFSEYNQLVDKNVWYTTRHDVIEGVECLVIAQIAELKKVNVVESVKNVKLIPLGNKREVCNCSIKNTRNGDFYPGCVALLCDHEAKSSAKTTWIDCKMIDADSREFVLRIFTKNIQATAEKAIAGWHGKYVQFDMKVTQYGYQTEEIDVLQDEIVLSPEVEVARNIIMQEMLNDAALMEYEKKVGILNILTNTIDSEPGYALVRIASEIFMINSLENISSNFDIKAMKRAAICSRGYYRPSQKSWSKSLLNTNLALKVKELGDDEELIHILDVMTETEVSPTKHLYIAIRNVVDDILKIRSGTYVSKDFIDSSVMRSLGWLL